MFFCIFFIQNYRNLISLPFFFKFYIFFVAVQLPIILYVIKIYEFIFHFMIYMIKVSENFIGEEYYGNISFFENYFFSCWKCVQYFVMKFSPKKFKKFDAMLCWSNSTEYVLDNEAGYGNWNENKNSRFSFNFYFKRKFQQKNKKILIRLTTKFFQNDILEKTNFYHRMIWCKKVEKRWKL